MQTFKQWLSKEWIVAAGPGVDGLRNNNKKKKNRNNKLVGVVSMRGPIALVPFC